MARQDKTPAPHARPVQAEEPIDGRRRRSERSRERIVEALLDLVKSGEMSPSAAQVADTANVSLRTVFRHFEEMESLYREMARVCEARFRPTFMSPYKARDWPGQLKELLDRRVQFFEDAMHLRICCTLRRFQSPTLMEDYQRFLRMEHSGIEALLPEDRLSDSDWVSSLDVALNFETYRRLRQERGLSQSAATAVMSRMLHMIMADAGEGCAST